MNPNSLCRYSALEKGVHNFVPLICEQHTVSGKREQKSDLGAGKPDKHVSKVLEFNASVDKYYRHCLLLTCCVENGTLDLWSFFPKLMVLV